MGLKRSKNFPSISSTKRSIINCARINKTSLARLCQKKKKKNISQLFNINMNKNLGLFINKIKKTKRYEVKNIK